MKVCAVIVTYGDRFHLLKQVIESCFREGVNKVIVVDNASVKNSRKQLKKFEEENKNKLKVIYLDKNTGSAGGYKRGLEEAYSCKECEYILTLDDDNVLMKGFFNEIINNLSFINENTAILTNRIDKKFIEKKLFKSPLKNSFLGFHIKQLFVKQNINNKIEVAPYGGLFFHKKLLNKIGYPNEKFFLYVDDFEWSYKIPNIFYLKSAKIRDIEKETISKGGMRYFFKKTDFQLYYGIRNRLIWERQNFINRKSIYYLNKYFYLIILKILHPFNEKWKILKKALKDAK